LRRSNVIYHLINAVIFIILEVTALNMLRNNGSLQNIWFSKGMQAISGTVWGSTQNIKHYFSLKKRNDALAEENHRLRLKIAELSADAEQMPELPEDGIVEGFRYIPATIVKISNNTAHNYIIIGKGSDDGVSKGSGVITSQGAIGVIDAVARRHSYARSFRNHEMSISARLGKRGAVGPMSWDGFSSTRAILREIPLHVVFEKGDTVYTSGYSSIFPPDIPLGTAGEAKIVNGATYDIDISLFEDFGALRYVTIVENIGREEIEELEDAL